MSRKIHIIGGGIGGLTLAHELCKNPLYDISIFEKREDLGGQARSKSIFLNGEIVYHSEYCWHAVGAGYLHFLSVINEINDQDGNKVISHLRPLQKYIYNTKTKSYVEYSKPFILNRDKFSTGIKNLYDINPIKDYIKLKGVMSKIINMCEERLNTYDKIKWIDYIDNLKINPNLRRWIVDSTSIIMGMDYSNLSAELMMRVIRQFNQARSILLDTAEDFYNFDGPMNNVLFDNWERHLINNGVKIYKNAKLSYIHVNVKNKHDHISHINIKFKDIPDNLDDVIKINSNEICIGTDEDIYVNGLDVKALARFYPYKSNFNELYNASRQIQTQVLYKLNFKLNTDMPTVILLPDSPFFIMIRVESDHWDLKECDYLSAGIGIWDIKGYNGKTALDCTLEELANECWHQITESKHNLNLPEDLPEWNIWDSFYFDEKINTNEPKFSNNINTLFLRPKGEDITLKNLYHSTAYCQTETNIFCMESACEAGINSANLIKKKHNDSINKLKTREVASFGIKFMRSLDRYLFKLENLFKK